MKQKTISPLKTIVREARLEPTGLYSPYATGRAVRFSTSSLIADQIWSATSTSKPIRAGQISSGLDCRKCPYLLIASGPRNTWRFPTRCPATNPNRHRPDPAMIYFFPSDDWKMRLMIFIR